MEDTGAAAAFRDRSAAEVRHGDALCAIGRFAQAMGHYEAAVTLDPESHDALVRLGTALLFARRIDDAVELLRRATRIAPRSAAAHRQLASSLMEAGDLDDAAARCSAALALDATMTDAWVTLGLTRHQQGRFDEALGAYAQALRLDPSHAEAHTFRGTTLLLLGRASEGLSEYEWRRRGLWIQRRASRLPAWDGSALAGRGLLLEAEQGIGDAVQFVRFAARVREAGGVPFLGAADHLRPLLASCPDIEACFPPSAALPPGLSISAPLASLPFLLSGDPDDLMGSAVPYLHLADDVRRRGRARLSELTGRRVGIAWQGNPGYRFDRLRSIPLSHFLGLASVPGVTLISLQRYAGMEQLSPTMPIVDLGRELDLLETAGVVRELDLVVSSDTSLAHLAGALGVPVWVALPHVPDWRWGLAGETTPWYPTMRLFR